MWGMESLFIDASMEHASHLHGKHTPGLVLLSLFVSIFSSIMALQTVQLARKTSTVLHRYTAIGTGAIALGGGIWTMHFIGMLSFEIPIHVHYSTSLTLVSIIPALIASWLALSMLIRPRVSGLQLVTSGTLVGAGIGTMHYVGMAAMQVSAEMRYEPATFMLSIVVAVALAVLALWVGYGLKLHKLDHKLRLAFSGIVMGLAIAGMHYTGMAAVRFIGEPNHGDTEMLLNSTYVSLALSSFTITISLMVATFNGLLRSRELLSKVESSELRLRATLDTAVDGIITINNRGLIQSFNHSAERLFGWSAEEVIGRNIKILMPEPDQSRHDSYLHNYLTSSIAKIMGTSREITGMHKDGSHIPMRLAVGRVDLRDELLFVGFLTDISERHALESSLRETAERAERAAAAKSTFLATMSHEIRTPMNSIIGFTELLLQGDLTTTQHSHLNTVRQSSISLLGLLDDILDTTKMEKGNLTLESIHFSLKCLAFQVQSSLQLGAQAKNLSLFIRYPDNIPEYFQGDPLRILQILTNLLGNAIKFTERGYVELLFSYTDGNIHIQVRDTGIGMTEQQLQSIFAPFTQADATISRRFGGTGLGTTIARQLAELMHGRIEVESQPGQGSTFHVHFPLPLGEKPESPQPVSGTYTLPPLNILIADDVAQNLELLSLTLNNGGHQVVAASNGDEAIRKFMDNDFDIILMDVHMPITDGLQATRLIRQHERKHNLTPTPIIALTASVMAEDRQAALMAGMNGFAVKPLDIPRLFDEIAHVLNIDQTIAPASNEALPPTTHHTLIDWQAGVARWGSKSALTSAIRNFVANVASNHPLPESDASNIDWETTLRSLHNIYGAAGNLALPAIASLAGSLESAIRYNQREQALQQIPELRRLLESAVQELPAIEPVTQPQHPLPIPAATPELHDQIQKLLPLLQRNELDPAMLEVICSTLESQENLTLAQELRMTIDAFEFEQAHQLLQQFIAAQPTSHTGA